MKLKIFNFKRVNSTNDVAIRMIKNSKSKLGMIVSETQKKGRGNHGKKWISYKGNLFVSIFFCIDRINLSIKQLTKVNCFLIKRLISIYYKNHISIKYPNDLLINKKKVSGILQETLKKKNSTYIIVGIGINLVKSPKIRNYKTTNLSDITKIKINKKRIIYDLKSIYENFIPLFFKKNVKSIISI